MLEEVDIEPWNDVTPAAWIRPRLRPFTDYSAGSVVPTGFVKYARIDNESYGKLAEDACRALTEVLVLHTSEPERFWLAVWNGYGGIYGSAETWTTTATWFRPGDPPPLVHRRLRQVPVRHQGDSLIRHENRDFLLYRGRPENIPDGGSEALIADLLAIRASARSPFR